VAPFYSEVEAEADTRMTMDYQLFHGVSIHFKDVANAEEKAAKVNALPAVKAIYPVKTYSIPKPEVVWTAAKGRDYIDLRRRQEGNDTFSTHVMTQVDKLRGEGFTGKGIKIAVIDSGVSLFAWGMPPRLWRRRVCGCK
jgi:subtilisin family serine protease